MKSQANRSSTASRLAQSPGVGIFCLACVIALAAFTTRAGSIFDDDWTPPKPVSQQHPVPIQVPPVAPTPAPAATNPAAVPPPSVQPAPAPQSPSRRAIPAKADQARSRGLLKEAFAKQLKDRSSGGRKKLAQSLIDEVPKAADNPVDQYVLLGGAIDASKEAASLPLCFQAADLMASEYEVDGLSVKIEAALKVNLRGDSPAVAAENVNAALELIDPLLAAEDFTTAARILTSVRPAASGDPALAADIQKRIRTVESFRTAHDRLAQHLQKLKTSPDDPAANLAVGSYLCFNKGEWDKSLPMLAKGSDANLKQLAELEIARPTSAEDMIRLGDRWWDFGAKQPDAIRGEIDRHAASIYKTALESATGLRRTLMERRIAEAGEQIGATPPDGAPDTFTNSIGMKFVRVKAGEFLMGSPADEAGHQDNETLHHVKITRPFMIATTTVTQAHWKAVMGKNPSHFKDDTRPVETISSGDVMEFCQKLSTKEGKHYRLPTEAEWEYSCRAGSQSAFCGGNNLDEIGWSSENGSGQSHPVGQKKPNAWGLYDMQGNVWQLCSDGFGPYTGDAVDPVGAGDLSLLVLRGGSWRTPSLSCRAATRKRIPTNHREDNQGFRIVLELPGNQAPDGPAKASMPPR